MNWQCLSEKKSSSDNLWIKFISGNPEKGRNNIPMFSMNDSKDW